MAAAGGTDVSSRNNFFTLRDRFETMTTSSSPTDVRRGTISSGSCHLETHTLGRKITRGSSFSYSSKPSYPKSSSPHPPSGLFPFVQRSRSSSRSLQDSGYDSFTLATPPRRYKFKHHDTVDCGSPQVGHKKKMDYLTVGLSPAQSMTSLSSQSSVASSSPSSLRSSPFMSSSVFNLNIEPSQCVSCLVN